MENNIIKQSDNSKIQKNTSNVLNNTRTINNTSNVLNNTRTINNTSNISNNTKSINNTSKIENDLVKMRHDIDGSVIDYYKFSKKIFITQIVLLALFFLLITTIAYYIVSVIWGIKTLQLTTKNNKLNKSKTIWGILSFFFVGIVCTFIFNNQIKNVYPSVNEK